MPSHDPAQRVDDILQSIDRIESYVERAGGVDALLKSDSEFRDAVERRRSVISEAAVKLGDLAEELEPSIPWHDIRGLGNTLRHHYDRVNPRIVRAILKRDLTRLAAACMRMKVALVEQDRG